MHAVITISSCKLQPSVCQYSHPVMQICESPPSPHPDPPDPHSAHLMYRPSGSYCGLLPEFLPLCGCVCEFLYFKTVLTLITQCQKFLLLVVACISLSKNPALQSLQDHEGTHT